MIPCRLFLQNQLTVPELLSCPKPKLSLTLNSIFYDEIKAFQTKYFCLTTQDTIGIQAHFQINQNELSAGSVTILEPYRLALQSKVMEIKIKCNADHKNNRYGIKEIILFISIEPVKAFKRDKLAQSLPSESKRVQRFIEQNMMSRQNQNESQNQMQISFSHREVITDTINLTHGSKDYRILKQTSNYNNFNYNYKDIPLFSDSLKSMPEQNQSLQSLAQQREKILGELFGRFKAIK